MTMVTKKGASRRERNKAAFRDRIVCAGIALYSRRGIDGVTVEEIAEAADVGKGTIYNYFQTKEDIVVAFLVDVERRVQERLERSAGLRSGATVEAVLSEFLLTEFRLKARYLQFVRVFLGHMFMHTEQFLPYMAEMQKAVDPPLDAMFGELQRRGAIRADVDRGELMLIFKTIRLGLTSLWAIEGPPFRSTKRVLRKEMKLFAEGLERKP